MPFLFTFVFFVLCSFSNSFSNSSSSSCSSSGSLSLSSSYTTFLYFFELGRFAGINFFVAVKIVPAAAVADLENAVLDSLCMLLVLYFQQLFYRSSDWLKQVFF